MQEIAVEGKLCQFIKQYCDNQSSVQLLLFLGRHPLARFSLLAIAHALGVRKEDTGKTLDYLVGRGLVLMRTAENGLIFYFLTDEEPRRGLALELASLDWRQYQLVLEQAGKIYA